MIKFPSINQSIKNVVRHVNKVNYSVTDPVVRKLLNFPESIHTQPTIRFHGTIKLHGTNAAIVFNRNPDGTFSPTFQSGERELTPAADNFGFAEFFVEGDGQDFIKRTALLAEKHYIMWGRSSDRFALFGEWCGKGIQKGVGVSEIERMFVVFAQCEVTQQEVVFMDTTSNLILDLKEGESIFSVCRAPVFQIDIDFNDPKVAQAQIVEWVNQVEASCPFAKTFSVDGIGEGLVFRPVFEVIDEESVATNEQFLQAIEVMESTEFWFKAKGKQHAVASHVHTLAPIDIEKHNSLNSFIDSVVTEPRLEQAIFVVRNERCIPFIRENIAEFIRWVVADILKEEADTIELNGFNPRKVSGSVAHRARAWFFDKQDSNVTFD